MLQTVHDKQLTTYFPCDVFQGLGVIDVQPADLAVALQFLSKQPITPALARDTEALYLELAGQIR
jgi:hypothetical protein